MLRAYSVERTAQAAGILLRLADNQRMAYVRLLKLLYLADRESIAETGFPITGDDPFAMQHGPVLSITYDLIKGKSPDPRVQQWLPVWKQWVRTVADYDVELAADPGHRKLSRYERQKVHGVFERCAGRDHWAIIDEMHESLPEWQETYKGDGSSTPIPVEVLLRAVGRAKDMDAILADSSEHLSFSRSRRRLPPPLSSVRHHGMRIVSLMPRSPGRRLPRGPIRNVSESVPGRRGFLLRLPRRHPAPALLRRSAAGRP